MYPTNHNNIDVCTSLAVFRAHEKRKSLKMLAEKLKWQKSAFMYINQRALQFAIELLKISTRKDKRSGEYTYTIIDYVWGGDISMGTSANVECIDVDFSHHRMLCVNTGLEPDRCAIQTDWNILSGIRYLFIALNLLNLDTYWWYCSSEND